MDIIELRTNLPRIHQLKCASRGPPDQVALKWLKSGPRLGKLKFPSISATVLQSKYLNQDRSYKTEISIAFKDARFRDVRKLLNSIGLAVSDAERRKYGPFMLDRIGPGQVAELTPRVVESSLDKAIPHWREYLVKQRIGNAKQSRSKSVVNSQASDERAEAEDDDLLETAIQETSGKETK